MSLTTPASKHPIQLAPSKSKHPLLLGRALGVLLGSALALESAQLDSSERDSPPSPAPLKPTYSNPPKAQSPESTSQKPSQKPPLQEQVSLLLLPNSPSILERHIRDVFGEKELDLRVQAIFNGKALIHDTWYKQGERIGVFTITHIGAQAIELTDKKGSTKTLSLQNRAFP